jgi:quercetin dioxygenase-like cupin family protein
VFLFFACVPLTRAVDPVSAAPVNYAEILKANPMKAGEQSQAIKVAEDDTTTMNVARFARGLDVKAHLHKAHTETMYVIEGKIEMTIGGKTRDYRPGDVIFVPMNTVHAAKIADSGDLIVLQILTPAMTCCTFPLFRTQW